MKSIKNKVITLVLSAVMLLNISIITHANTNNIFSLDDVNINRKVIELSRCVVSEEQDSVKEFTSSNTNLFTEFEKEELLKTSSRIQKIEGNISDCEVMRASYDKTSTVDTVIIVDMKIENNNYNRMILIEYHINKEGKIYGHNVWVY